MALDTRTSLIRSAESLLRSNGYSAFSFADLEKSVGIRKASIHHHFPTKEDLGVEIVQTYISQTQEELQRIDELHVKALDRLKAFAALFQKVINDGTLPLCGALAAEMGVMPVRMQALTKRYFETHLGWLEQTINFGADKGEFSALPNARQKAYQFLSLLEGASFVSWALRDGTALDSDVVLTMFGPG